MFTTYVLRDKNGKFYKGVTGDLNRRLKEHRKGDTKTTKRMESLSVFYTEKFETFAEARARELYLKSAAGRRFLKNMGD